MSATEAFQRLPLIFSMQDGSISTTPIVVDYRHQNSNEYLSTELFSLHCNAFVNAMDDRGNVTKDGVLSVLDGRGAKSKLSADEVDFLGKSLAEHYRHVRFIWFVLFF